MRLFFEVRLGSPPDSQQFYVHQDYQGSVDRVSYAGGTGDPSTVEQFSFDACANGQQLKCLTVIDEFTRECLAIDVAGSIRSGRVIEVLSKLVSVHGAPRYLRSDNGPEFVSRAILRWLHGADIDTAPIDPGKPWQNGLNESFNGKFRDECLSLHWFKNRIDAKILIEGYRREYNEVRPHSSLGQLTPAEFKLTLLQPNPARAILQ